ncbi:MAG: energy transducer TonB [Ferruginibacter sp.]
MKTEQILKSDVLDIIFENRNKAYGAYALRKFYDNRLMKSVAAMLVVVVVLSAFTFIPKNSGEYSVRNIALPENEFATAKPKEKPVDPVKPPPPKTQVPMQKFLKDIKIVQDPDDSDSLPDYMDKKMIGSVTINVPGDGPLVFGAPGPGTGEGPVAAPVKPVVDITQVRETAEVMPSFPGGMDGLKKFLQRNLNNPKEMEDGEMVSVKMKFVVGYDGKLKGFETIQDGGEEFNKEVLRVLKKMPEWVPGKSNGQNVSVYYTIPVKFVGSN